VKGVQEALAIKEASADELSADVIAKHFPKIELRVRPMMVVFYAFQCLAFILIGVAVSGAGIAQLEKPMAYYALIPIALVLAYFCFRYMSRWFGQTLTLDHRGIHLNSWTKALEFSDVESVEAISSGTLISMISVSFILREAQPSREKRPMFWDGKRKVTVNLHAFSRKADELAANVIRYFERGVT
jgi:hypothetical protein